MTTEVAGRLQHTPSLAWWFVALLIVLLFDPGIMSNDSIVQLQQARTFEFNDWHPPIMAIVWSVLDKIVPGPAGMLVAQSILYAYSCARICAYAFPQLNGRLPPWLVVVAFSLFPPAMTLTGMIWKDVWMSGLLLLGLSFLFSMAGKTDSASRVRDFLILTTCCLLATAFRHNGLAATAGLLAGGLYLLFGSERRYALLQACMGGVVLALLLSGLVSLSNRAIAQPGHITTPLMMYDIAGMIVKSPDPERAAQFALSAPVHLTSHPSQFLDRVRAGYSPAAASQLIRNSRRRNTAFDINVYDPQHDAMGVERLWRSMVAEYPGAYLRHRAGALRCLLQLCGRESWVFHSYFLNSTYAFPESLQNDRLQYALRKLLLNPRTAILYLPAAWFLITLAGIYVGWTRRSERRSSLLLFMGLSSLGLVVSLFFASPIESYRYVHWTVMIGWIMFFMALNLLAARGPAAGGESKGVAVGDAGARAP